MAYSIVATALNQLAGGVDKIEVLNFNQGSGDGSWYSLGPLDATSLDVKTNAPKESHGRPKPCSLALTVKGKMMGTDKTACLKYLDTLSRSVWNYRITMQNGRTVYGSFGFEWGFVSDKDFDDYRYIDFTMTRKILIDHATQDDLAAFLATPPDGTNAKDAGDALYGFLPATLYPAGMPIIEFRGAGETDWSLDNIELFDNVTLKIAPNSKMDSIGRNICQQGVAVSLSFDIRSTSAALAVMYKFQADPPSIRATGTDGTLFTFVDKLGTGWNWQVPESPADNETIKITAEGYLVLSTFDTIIS